MSDFIVSARKYRPATFSSVVGQKHITSTLKNAIERGQLAHAYLFCGPRGVGKTTCARIFAKAINCLHPEGAEACNTCESCRSFNDGRSLNIHELDAASNNSVEDIRSLIEQVRIIPQVGRYSVFIIDEVHMLSAAAFNAFLKTLEEPPAHAIFILATTEKHKIIPTILSRCQIYDFNRIRVEDSVEYLKYIASQEGITADEVHMLSAAAFNAFLKTLEEPPAHAIFILATTEKHKIIPTILSRCQIYDFNRIRVEDSVEYLKYIASQEGITADDESLNLIAQKADGGMRDALSMFDKAVSFCGQELRYQEVAQTLNVLDYDTYFSMTETLLSGNYVEALLSFDNVLARGFSGQTFMAGLNRHLRDLLVARNEPSLRLLEFTGTLMERYRTQAAACPPEFLFGAISLLTDLDGKIRQSSNQRLLVELGLMKIAGLGQKKNSPVDPVNLPLPELVRTAPAQSAPARPQSTQQTAPAPAPQPATVQRPTAAAAESSPGIAASAPAATPAAKAAADPAPPATSAAARTSAMPTPSIQPVPERTQAAATPVSTQPQTARPRPVQSRLASGISISALINDAAPEPDTETAVHAAAPQPVIDPLSAEKLETTREKILTLVREMRPRFVAAFERMQFQGHVIRIAVPSEALREEILRNKTELLLRIAETSGVQGMLELDVTINEEIRAARPIKLEDRVKYMTEKNPLLAELRRALDLEVE